MCSPSLLARNFSSKTLKGRSEAGGEKTKPAGAAEGGKVKKAATTARKKRRPPPEPLDAAAQLTASVRADRAVSTAVSGLLEAKEWKKGGKVRAVNQAAFLAKVRDAVPGLRGRDIATIMLACRKLEIRDRNLWDQLCGRVIQVAGSLKAVDIANILNLLSHHGKRNRDTVEALCREALGKAADFTANGIASTLNAMANFGHHDQVLVASLCDEAHAKASDFTAQSIANTLRATAVLGGDRELTTRLCDEAVAKVSDFDAQAIGNTLLALAHLGHRQDALVDLLLAGAKQRVKKFLARDITRTLDAMARLGQRGRWELVGALCGQAEKKAGDFGPQDIATFLQALAALEHSGDKDGGVVARLCGAAVAKAKSFSAHAIATTLAALDRLGYRDQSLEDCLWGELHGKDAKALGENELTGVLECLEVLGQREGAGVLDRRFKKALLELQHS